MSYEYDDGPECVTIPVPADTYGKHHDPTTELNAPVDHSAFRTVNDYEPAPVAEEVADPAIKLRFPVRRSSLAAPRVPLDIRPYLPPPARPAPRSRRRSRRRDIALYITRGCAFVGALIGLTMLTAAALDWSNVTSPGLTLTQLGALALWIAVSVLFLYVAGCMWLLSYPHNCEKGRP